jgi:hypothetical protein
MATVQVYGPYWYIPNVNTGWPPGTNWYAWWGPWPASSDGTVTVTAHPQAAGGNRRIAAVETVSYVDNHNERYIECTLRNTGEETILVFFAYVSLLQP